MKRAALLLLVWSGLSSALGIASTSGYYLGWAEVTPVSSEIRVSFNPINCDVASLVAILPQTNGVLIAHFDVPLVEFSDEPGPPQPGKIVAKKAQLVADRSVRDASNPPYLILGKNWDVRGIEVASGRSFKRAELALLTQETLDSLGSVGLFGKVTVIKRRNHDGDPLKVLKPIGSPDVPTLARISAPDGKDGMKSDGMKSLSGCCHILLFYGLGPTDLSYFTRGDSALKALTDEAAAIAAFGKSPFIRTRNGLRYLLSNDPVFHSDVGEAHQDQCLATFAALDLPLGTPIHLKSGSYSISNLLCESVGQKSAFQEEAGESVTRGDRRRRELVLESSSPPLARLLGSRTALAVGRGRV